jgi:hypothetical protein
MRDQSASGAGPAADDHGNIYFLAANGTFDTTIDAKGFPSSGDFGNSFLKLSTSNRTLAVADYFAMFNTVAESDADQDLGSGGALVLPQMRDALGQFKYLAVGAGKDRSIYLVNRTRMGKFNPNNNSNIYQELPGALSGPEFAMPAYFNNTLYYGAVGDYLKAFNLTMLSLATVPARKPATILAIQARHRVYRQQAMASSGQWKTVVLQYYMLMMLPIYLTSYTTVIRQP